MDQRLRQFEKETGIELGRCIGRGGMSDIYEGQVPGAAGFQKRVAIKMLNEALSKDPKSVELLVSEAKLVSDLVHENIVQIYFLGQVKQGPYYISMEYVEGIPLSKLLAHHRKNNLQMPEALAVYCMSRIARGLAYAHGARDREGQLQEIVHRDVCPGNILLSTAGTVRLTDFGIARAVKQLKHTENWIAGKVPYMAPEQSNGSPVDYRADIFALGAVLFELLSGERIRDGELELLESDLATIPIPWEKLPATTSDEMIELMHKMLDADPDRRVHNTSDMAQALEMIIYRSGYGPTSDTLVHYLRQYFPELFKFQSDPHAVQGTENDQTLRIEINTQLLQAQAERAANAKTILVESPTLRIDLDQFEELDSR